MVRPERYVGHNWILNPGESVQYIRLYSTSFSDIVRHIQAQRPRQPQHRPLVIAAGMGFISSHGRAFAVGVQNTSRVTSQAIFDIREWQYYPSRGMTNVLSSHGRIAGITACTWGPSPRVRVWHLIDNTFLIATWPRLRIEPSAIEDALLGA